MMRRFLFSLAQAVFLFMPSLLPAKPVSTVSEVIEILRSNPHRLFEVNGQFQTLHVGQNIYMAFNEDGHFIEVGYVTITPEGDVFINSYEDFRDPPVKISGDTEIDAYVTDKVALHPLLDLLDAFSEGPIKGFGAIPDGARFWGNHIVTFPNDPSHLWGVSSDAEMIVLRTLDGDFASETAVSDLLGAQSK
jgi:hypothetical protein